MGPGASPASHQKYIDDVPRVLRWMKSLCHRYKVTTAKLFLTHVSKFLCYLFEEKLPEVRVGSTRLSDIWPAKSRSTGKACERRRASGCSRGRTYSPAWKTVGRHPCFAGPPEGSSNRPGHGQPLHRAAVRSLLFRSADTGPVSCRTSWPRSSKTSRRLMVGSF